jgi:hypothetical protein
MGSRWKTGGGNELWHFCRGQGRLFVMHGVVIVLFGFVPSGDLLGFYESRHPSAVPSLSHTSIIEKHTPWYFPHEPPSLDLVSYGPAP